MDLIVGTFNNPTLYALHFTPPTPSSPSPGTGDLRILRDHPAISPHSWLAFSPTKTHLYATAWTKPNPSIAAYRVKASGRDIQFLNAKPVTSLPGYVCANETHAFAVGGATGEVFRLEADGSLGNLVQELDFVTDQGENVSEKRGDVPYGSFGGLRHGAHSCDLSPDGRTLYVADIGRNCIWTFDVGRTRDVSAAVLAGRKKWESVRGGDGPRHVWPHPRGEVVYCLQEHTSMVDVFAVGAGEGVALEHKQGVKIIPAEEDVKKYWADEVRVSTGPDAKTPRYLYASTRGLEAGTKGWVAVFSLREDGILASEEAIHIWQTPTSGGMANAIEPAPWEKRKQDDVEYLAMTDSEEGWVFMLSFDGKEIKEVARLNLGKNDEGKAVGCATAVWLGDQAPAGVDFFRHR